MRRWHRGKPGCAHSSLALVQMPPLRNCWTTQPHLLAVWDNQLLWDNQPAVGDSEGGAEASCLA